LEINRVPRKKCVTTASFKANTAKTSSCLFKHQLGSLTSWWAMKPVLK
jgi:hypothetical protein